MAQKHAEGPEGDQHDLVRSRKSGSGPTEMEINCGRPMSPMGQRGLDDDDDDDDDERWVVLQLIALQRAVFSFERFCFSVLTTFFCQRI